MKIPTLSPLSIFGFGQESTPVSSEPGFAATTSQCQGYPGPGRRARGDVLHGAASSMSLAELESMSQDMEPLSPVTREYRRRPRNLSSELTEPKVRCFQPLPTSKPRQNSIAPFCAGNKRQLSSNDHDALARYSLRICFHTLRYGCLDITWSHLHLIWFHAGADGDCSSPDAAHAQCDAATAVHF